MKYPRPEYKDPNVKTATNTTGFFADTPVTAPLFDTPISRRENFFRAARRENPLWVPVPYTDIQLLQANEQADERPGQQMGPRFKNPAKKNYSFLDPFGNSWTWEASAGGAMLTPGTKVVEDICDWEKSINFPDFNDWNFRETAEKYMKEKYDPEKVMQINIYQGLTEMLVAFLGGYGEGMMALAEEPEACKDFFWRFAQYMIDFFDMMDGLYPIDFVTWHDDYGTERDTFFSEKMMEELVLEPTKKLTDHIKKKGKILELHSCGKIERFIPHIIEMGVDFIWLQPRANDMVKIKAMYGDKIGFNFPLDGMIPGVEFTTEEIIQSVRSTIDKYAKGGGYYPLVRGNDLREVWTIASELYCYSREFYENQ